MKTQSAASAVTWLVVAAGAVAEGLRLGLGSARKPGPGFFPVLAAAALAVLAVALVFQPVSEEARSSVSREGSRRLLGALAALVAYALALERLGFLLSTFGFVWILLAAVDRKSPAVALGFAAGTAIVAEVLFNRLLQAQLPSGLLSVVGF